MAALGFIGMGNMGYAVLKGTQKAFAKEDIIFHSNTMEKMKQIADAEGISYKLSNQEVTAEAKYIILAVKPQMFEKILPELKESITPENVVISLAPGVTIAEFEEMCGTKRIVRTMPNTPAMVGEGMTGVSYHKENFTQEECEVIEKIFSSIGKMSVVEEKLLDAVVCASGSSPAYVFMFIEAMADAAVAGGMPRQQAYKFAAQAVLGSAKMVLETGKHPGELKDMVCSPAGTTIQAVRVLEEKGMRSSVIEAMMKCLDISRNM